jgi:hypothetical protein
MKNLYSALIFVLTMISPLIAVAEGNYYYEVTSGRDKAIAGLFPTLAQCQEANARALGRASKSQIVGACYKR